MTKQPCRLWLSVPTVGHGTSTILYVVIVATTVASWQSKKRWQSKNRFPFVDFGRSGGKNEQKSPLDLFFGTFFLF